MTQVANGPSRNFSETQRGVACDQGPRKNVCGELRKLGSLKDVSGLWKATCGKAEIAHCVSLL